MFYKGRGEHSVNELEQMIEERNKNAEEHKVMYQDVLEKHAKILKYCKPHMDYTWASVIVATILDCDFRDAQNELFQILEGTENNEK